MRRSDPRLPLAALGVASALGGFGAAFRGPPSRFWQRMTLTAAALGGLALAGGGPRAELRPRPGDLPAGLAAAAALYVVFQAGDALATRVLPAGEREIERIYALRRARPRGEIAARLAAVIAPAEELFWRGLLQGTLADRVGRWRAAALASALYGGVHLVSGNLTLAAAAGTAGAFWSALRAAGLSLPALIVSHIAWDVWIFLVAPTRSGRTAG